MENTLDPTPPTAPKPKEPPLPGPKPRESQIPIKKDPAPIPGPKKEPPPIPGQKPVLAVKPGIKENSDEEKTPQPSEVNRSQTKAAPIEVSIAPSPGVISPKEAVTPATAIKDKASLGNSQYHGSIEVLNSKQLASSNKGKWEEPQSAATPVPKMQTLVEQMALQSASEAASPVDLSEHTGYKSGKVPKVLADESSPRVQSRTLSRAETVRSPSKGESRSFKHWYINALKSHDSPKFPIINKSDVPKQYKLETIFGIVGENVDPFDRLMWMARCYAKLKSVPHWRKAQREITNSQNEQPTGDIDTDPKLDARNVVLIDLKIDTSSELRKIESGKIDTLINSLIFPLDQGFNFSLDMSFPEVFLATYRYFLSSHTLFRYLRGWYEAEDDLEPGKKPARPNEKEDGTRAKLRKQVQARAIKILNAWITNHWYDFKNNASLFDNLSNFVEDLEKSSFTSNQKLGQAIKEQRLQWYTMQFIPMFSIENGINDKKEWSVEAFAHNLTMIDFMLFKKMKPDIYLQIVADSCSVECGGFNVPLKTLLDHCEWFRMLVGYVAITISHEDNAKKRTKSISDFIKIAEKCISLRNYNGAFAIAYGLRQPSSLVWITSWEDVAPKTFDRYREILDLASPENNFANYFNLMETTNAPAVPFLLPYMQDLISINSNIPTNVTGEQTSKTVINFSKFYNVFSVAAELETFRTASYSPGELQGDRESNMQLLQHIRKVAGVVDDRDLGTGINFGEGTVPDGNKHLSISNAQKSIKKIMTMVGGIKEEK